MGETSPVAGVLLVLRRRETDVISDRDHQATANSNQRLCHQGVRGDIQPHVLHGADGATACQRGADGDFKRDLFVDRPFGVHV